MLNKLPLVNGLSRAKVYHKQEITKEHLVFYIEQVVMTILRLLAVLQKRVSTLLLPAIISRFRNTQFFPRFFGLWWNKGIFLCKTIDSRKTCICLLCYL